MNTPATEKTTDRSDLIWEPRPDRDVVIDDIQWGCVIRGGDGGYTTVDSVEYDSYYSEFGMRIPDNEDETVTVVADDDIMAASVDMRGRSAVELLRFVGKRPSDNRDWHFRINNLFLWGVITTMDDWDAAVAKAQTTKTGQTALNRLHRPVDEVRQAVENGLKRHQAKNAALGIDRRVYRVNW